MGAKDYSVGNHPVWELSRAIYQTRNRPLLVGGIALAAGYFWSALRRAEVSVNPGMVRFIRREQMGRLRKVFGLQKSDVERPVELKRLSF